MEREKMDLEYDLNRLEALNVKYASTSRELVQSSRDFDQAQDKRKDARLKLTGWGTDLNTHIDDDEKWSVNLDEVEQLCHIIELKDK
jgi:hypothetical protein